MIRVILSLVLFVSFAVYASNDSFLSIDPDIPNEAEIFLPNDDDTFPEKSDFKIISYIAMSSDDGERQALVTLENLSVGTRLFKNEQILGLFADGRRRTPLEKNMRFDGREVASVILSFGVSRFPLLNVYTAR